MAPRTLVRRPVDRHTGADADLADRRPALGEQRARREGGHEGVVVPAGWAVIGAVTEAGPEGPAVTVDGAVYDGPTGWTHF